MENHFKKYSKFKNYNDIYDLERLFAEWGCHRVDAWPVFDVLKQQSFNQYPIEKMNFCLQYLDRINNTSKSSYNSINGKNDFWCIEHTDAMPDNMEDVDLLLSNYDDPHIMECFDKFDHFLANEVYIKNYPQEDTTILVKLYRVIFYDYPNSVNINEGMYWYDFIAQTNDVVRSAELFTKEFGLENYNNFIKKDLTRWVGDCDDEFLAFIN